MSEVWVIDGGQLLEALRRVDGGDPPDVVYAELYANAEHEHYEGEP